MPRYVEPGPVVRAVAVILGLAAIAATVAATVLLMTLLNRCIGP